MVSLSYLIVCSVVAYIAGMFSPFRRPTDRVQRWGASKTEDERAKLFEQAVQLADKQRERYMRAAHNGRELTKEEIQEMTADLGPSQSGCPKPCKPGGCGRGCSIPPNSPHVPPRG